MKYVIVNRLTGRHWVAAGMGEALLYSTLAPYYVVYEQESVDGNQDDRG